MITNLYRYFTFGVAVSIGKKITDLLLRNSSNATYSLWPFQKFLTGLHACSIEQEQLWSRHVWAFYKLQMNRPPIPDRWQISYGRLLPDKGVPGVFAENIGLNKHRLLSGDCTILSLFSCPTTTSVHCCRLALAKSCKFYITRRSSYVYIDKE